MNKEQIIAELAKLYRLREEGKKVGKLIAELEAKLCDLMDCDEGEDTPSQDD